MTPRVEGKGREHFQTCIFKFSGVGQYRCGVDVAVGSIASKLGGNWATKVLVDGAVTDRTNFSL